MLGRFRRLGKARAGTEPPASAELTPRVEEIERRLSHLESALEGLQDGVYRESVRRSEQTAEMRRKIEPGAMSRALSDDARERGL
jgi:hypothetical protein